MSENENENESESENENESEMKVKMRTGTHRCHRCCRRLLLPSLLRSPLPPFLLLPLLVDFCPSHHCHGTVATISSTAAFVDCCLCPLCPPPLPSSSPVIFIIADTASRNRSRRSEPRGPLGPPSRNPACIDPREKTCGVFLPPPREDRVRDDNIGESRPRTPAPYPLPPRQLAAVSVPRRRRRDAATMMIPCLSIARPNATTADGDPSEPHTDANAIVEGDAEMKNP
jgi:hypothetical protein